MFEHDDGVVLIDQHSAHERVLYERFMGTLERGESPSQRLLFPMTLHLGPDEAEAFEAHRDAFEALGFEIEPFGGHSLIVQSVPMPHPRFDAERCLRETLAALPVIAAPERTRVTNAWRQPSPARRPSRPVTCFRRRDARAVSWRWPTRAPGARRPWPIDHRAPVVG